MKMYHFEQPKVFNWHDYQNDIIIGYYNHKSEARDINTHLSDRIERDEYNEWRRTIKLNLPLNREK